LRGFSEQSNSIPVEASPGRVFCHVRYLHQLLEADHALGLKLSAFLEAEGWNTVIGNPRIWPPPPLLELELAFGHHPTFWHQ